MGTWALATCLVQLHETSEPALVPIWALDIESLLLGSAVKGIAARLATSLERKSGADRSS